MFTSENPIFKRKYLYNILFIDGIAADSTVCFDASIGCLQNDCEYVKSNNFERRETVKHHCTPEKVTKTQ